MSPETQRAAVLESIIPQLEAEGFEVIAHPSRLRLPPFMQSHSPDAIALREDKNLAIQVLRKGVSTEGKLDKLRSLLAEHRDWELRVYWISPSSVPQPIEPPTRKDIEQAIETIEQLGGEGRLAPALLMSWATLEALGRVLLPEKISRPQTPARLVEALAAEGYVTPSEADLLRSLAGVRNRLIHGGLSETAGAEDADSFLAILRTLLDMIAGTAKQVAPQA
jgi:hypothetical protein